MHAAGFHRSFYRLSVVPIRVPPLRERRQDIGDLASYFLVEFCRRNNFRPKSIDDDVLPIFERYDWPGNVRELKNTIERMAILTPGARLTVESIPMELRLPSSSRSSDLHDVRNSAERDRILQVLNDTNWNVSSAARVLGTERTSLHKRIKALGITRG